MSTVWDGCSPEQAALCDAVKAAGADPQTIPADGGLSVDGYRTVVEDDGRPVVFGDSTIVTEFHPWNIPADQVAEIMRLDSEAVRAGRFRA